MTILQILRQRATHIAIGLLVLFAILHLAVPTPSLKRVFDAGRLGFALAVFAICLLPALNVFKNGVRSRGDQITVAITLVWGVILAQALWIPLSSASAVMPAWVPPQYVASLLPYLEDSRSFVMPTWFPRDTVGILLPYLYMISAAFFLIPIGNAREDMPSGNWPMIAAAGALGGLAVGLALGFGFNASL